jgi:hypothetical protein
MRNWLRNRWVMCLGIFGASAILGALIGAFLYAVSPWILPWWSELQRSLLFLVFLALGVTAGLCGAVYGLTRNRRDVSKVQVRRH